MRLSAKGFLGELPQLVDGPALVPGQGQALGVLHLRLGGLRLLGELLAQLLERGPGRLENRGPLLRNGNQGRLPHLAGAQLEQGVRHLGSLRVGADEPVEVARGLFEQFEEFARLPCPTDVCRSLSQHAVG